MEVDSLFDSGTQLSVIKENLIKPLQCDVLVDVQLLGFNGNMSTGKVVSLYARMKDHDVSIPIRFVACQHVTQNCLLSLADYRKLLQIQEDVLLLDRLRGLLLRVTTGGPLSLTRHVHKVICVVTSAPLMLIKMMLM